MVIMPYTVKPLTWLLALHVLILGWCKSRVNCVSKVDTCDTTVSLWKTTTYRIESHIRHVKYRIFIVYNSTQKVVYRGFTSTNLGRWMSHRVACSLNIIKIKIKKKIKKIEKFNFPNENQYVYFFKFFVKFLWIY